jgi:hypothetical protein
MVAMLLGPGLLALTLDKETGKPIARSVLLCGLAACVDPVRGFWSSGHGIADALALGGDPVVIGTAWGAAAAGWVLTEVAPLAVRAGLEAAVRAQAARLRAERAALIEAWGLSAPEPRP